MIMVGSGMFMRNRLHALKNSVMIPTVILCEGDGFEVLMKGSPGNLLYLTRPFDLDEIPMTLKKAIELCYTYKEKLRCT
jgi:hypothetical protein